MYAEEAEEESYTEQKLLLRMNKYIRVLFLLYVVQSFFDCTGELHVIKGQL